MPPSRRRLIGLLRIAVALVILAAVAWAVARNWTDVSGDLTRVRPGGAGRGARPGPGRARPDDAGLAGADGRPRVPAARRAVGRHLLRRPAGQVPAGVGVERPRAGRDGRPAATCPRRRSAVVGLVSIGLGVLTGLLVGLPALRPADRQLARRAALAWLLLALPLVVVACWPRAAERPGRHRPAGAAPRAAGARAVRAGGARDRAAVRRVVAGLRAADVVLARVGRRHGRSRLPACHAVGLRARRDDRPAGDHRPGRGRGARGPAASSCSARA